jgi:gamma-glutamyltranspeptidase
MLPHLVHTATPILLRRWRRLPTSRSSFTNTILRIARFTANSSSPGTAVERPPLIGAFDDLHVVSMPPPSSGGVALIESLNILGWLEQNRLDGRLESLGHNSPEYLHVLAEALNHAFSDRAEWLGDPDFVDVPVERLTSLGYAAELARRISLD